ncbi:hypothetical protein SAMN05444287_2246 [Octadecabacter temperatus]|uniref:Uncharacterized protein n=1 Tax=Octadecabacter temperatus TaxID=1458307 RepID=A0A0K0Y1M1_9RHOB|nr:hypothetical protein [Octadecabacter temperatus]AKS44839.1 hypothetical protein OSB_02710 [Octadecabacter temperatus]SIO34676.1 hypothetical protein SAMN05444287_2246 [Octadecabacter temperatus]
MKFGNNTLNTERTSNVRGFISALIRHRNARVSVEPHAVAVERLFEQYDEMAKSNDRSAA